MSMFGIGLLGVVAIVAWRYLYGNPVFEDESQDDDQQQDVLQAIESMQEGRSTDGTIDEESSADN